MVVPLGVYCRVRSGIFAELAKFLNLLLQIKAVLSKQLQSCNKLFLENRNMNNSWFSHLHFRSLLVSSMLTNGPASAAIPSQAMVNLHNCQSLHFDGNISVKSVVHSTGRLFHSLSQDVKTLTALPCCSLLSIAHHNKLLAGIHVCSRYTSKRWPRLMLGHMDEIRVTLEMVSGVL